MINRRQALGAFGGGIASLAGCTEYIEFDQGSSTGNDQDSGNTEYSSIVVFRNDDPAPWTDLPELRAVNDIFVSRGVPLTVGVVPYDSDQKEALSPDHEVCQYLNTVSEENTAIFENALHGYSHDQETDFYWGSEFGGLPYEEQQRKITESLQKFENCLGTTPTSFIPPFNTYDENTVEILSEQGFEIISGGGYFQEEHFGNEGLWRDDSIIHLPDNLAMEDSDTQQVKSTDVLKEEYDRNKTKHSLNVIMLHYTRYSGERELRTLDDIVRYAARDDSKLMTVGEFAKEMNGGNLNRTEDGWQTDE